MRAPAAPAIAAAILLLCCSLGSSSAMRALSQSSAAEQKKMGETHSGSAAGVVKAAGAGTKGAEAKIGGLDAYVVTPASSSSKPSAAVLLITDIFGFKADSVRRWADRLADAGYVVVIPDYFKGNPRKQSDSPDSFAPWLQQFPNAQVLNETSAVLADVRKQYPTVKKVGVQGFCWGGLYATLLTHGQTPAVQASVVYHGSLLTPADVESVNAPINFQQSDPELDRQMNTTLYKQVESILGKKKAAGLDASIVNYPKQAHGFSLRGDAAGDAAVAKASSTAFDAGLAFLDKHLQLK